MVQESGKKLPIKEKAKPKKAAPKKTEKPPTTGGKSKVTRGGAWSRVKKTKPEEESKNGTDDDNDNDEDQENLMRTKKGELEDWKLLKQTLRHGGEEDDIEMDLQEKADMLLEKKEELISKHMKYIRQVALMLKQEGELITQVQGPESDEEQYVYNMRKIVKQKLKIYQDLDRDLDDVDQLMKQEEEAYNQANSKH
jgi:hypothetical protein